MWFFGCSLRPWLTFPPSTSFGTPKLATDLLGMAMTPFVPFRARGAVKQSLFVIDFSI
jgi:hypothetical protein